MPRAGPDTGPWTSPGENPHGRTQARYCPVLLDHAVTAVERARRCRRDPRIGQPLDRGVAEDALAEWIGSLCPEVVGPLTVQRVGLGQSNLT